MKITIFNKSMINRQTSFLCFQLLHNRFSRTLRTLRLITISKLPLQSKIYDSELVQFCSRKKIKVIRLILIV